MTKYKRVRRKYWAVCKECLGSGSVGKDGQRKRCNVCDGKGEIEKVLNEIVHDSETDK